MSAYLARVTTILALLACAGAHSDDSAALLGRVDSAAHSRGPILDGYVVDFVCDFTTLRHLEIKDDPEDAQVVDFAEPKVSRFGLRIARHGDRELIDFAGEQVDPFHLAYPFARNAVRLKNGDASGSYLDRQRNVLVSATLSGRDLPEFRLMQLPTDLADRALSPEPTDWMLPEIEKQLSGEDVAAARAATRVESREARVLDSRFVEVTEVFTNERLRVAGEPLRGRRTTVYAQTQDLLPVRVELEVSGRIVQQWSISWKEAQGSAYIPDCITANHHFYIGGPDTGRLMAVANYRPIARKPLTDGDADATFVIQAPSDVVLVRDAASQGDARTSLAPIDGALSRRAMSWILYPTVLALGGATIILIVRSGREVGLQ